MPTGRNGVARSLAYTATEGDRMKGPSSDAKPKVTWETSPTELHEIMQKAIAEISGSREDSLRFLVEAGIMTPAGKLATPYR
jgi:hypothetical protein